jgi:hypothetical protein
MISQGSPDGRARRQSDPGLLPVSKNALNVVASELECSHSEGAK